MSMFSKVLSELMQGSAEIERWQQDCRSHTDTDTRRVGCRVVENLHDEQQFEQAPFKAFAETLAQTLANSTQGQDPSLPFNDACRQHKLKGPQARLPLNVVLNRIVSKRSFMKNLAIANGFSDKDSDTLYNSLMEPSTSEQTRRDFLQKAKLGRPGFVVWGAFDRSQPHQDPLKGLTAGRIKDLLGLSRDWYPDGEPIIRLRYLPPITLERKIPTVADAEWNEFWMPAPAGTGWGLTRDLTHATPTPGTGEVVHESGDLSWLVAPAIPDDISEY